MPYIQFLGPTTATPSLLPTVTPTGQQVPLVPTTTPTPALPTPSSLLAAPEQWRSLKARGTFSTEAIFADGTVSNQQGEFKVARVRADHAYDVDEYYRLSTTRTHTSPDVAQSGSDIENETTREQTLVEDEESIIVYQVGDRTVTQLGTNGQADGWAVNSRTQGSPFAKAIEPILDLAVTAPTALTATHIIATGALNGVAVNHYRTTDITLVSSLLPKTFVSADSTIQREKACNKFCCTKCQHNLVWIR